MENHYVCKGGCGGSSEAPAVCQTEGCANMGKPMEECSCTDGMHGQGSEQDKDVAEEGGDM